VKTLFERDFGHRRFAIGMVHTLASPGAPGYDRAGGVRRIVERALEEARLLHDAGFHALLFCNESDMPYQTRCDASAVAAMCEAIAAVRAKVRLPFGVNMLLDPMASLAIADVSGGRFIRGFLSGSYVGDLGHYTPDGAAILRHRAALGAESVRILCNVTAGFSINLDRRPVEDIAAGAVFIGLADSVVVSGPAAGREADMALIERVAARVPDTPVTVGTGVSAENIARLLRFADAVIVGTSIKADGKTLNPIDGARAAAFMKAFEAAA
jgi:hypothetical protein